MRRSPLALAGAVAALVTVVALAVVVALVLSVTGRGDGPGGGMGAMMSSSQRMQSGPGGGPGGRMHDLSAVSEFDFLAEMTAHHEEAVAAAGELERSSRAEMRAFGTSIITTQSAQIDLMRGWMARWYPGRSPDVDYQPMMRDLAGLSGDELDETFLQDMVGHHMMAVMMSQRLLVRGAADHPAVDDLAQSIRDEQHAEILQMQRWLADWFDTGWRPGPGRGMGSAMR